jgi:hypothetical protein
MNKLVEKLQLRYDRKRMHGLMDKVATVVNGHNRITTLLRQYLNKEATDFRYEQSPEDQPEHPRVLAKREARKAKKKAASSVSTQPGLLNSRQHAEKFKDALSQPVSNAVATPILPPVSDAVATPILPPVAHKPAPQAAPKPATYDSIRAEERQRQNEKIDELAAWRAKEKARVATMRNATDREYAERERKRKLAVMGQINYAPTPIYKDKNIIFSWPQGMKPMNKPIDPDTLAKERARRNKTLAGL